LFSFSIINNTQGMDNN